MHCSLLRVLSGTSSVAQDPPCLQVLQDLVVQLVLVDQEVVKGLQVLPGPFVRSILILGDGLYVNHLSISVSEELPFPHK